VEEGIDTALEMHNTALEQSGNLEQSTATVRNAMFRTNEFRSRYGLPLLPSGQSMVPPPRPNTSSHARRVPTETNVGSWDPSNIGRRGQGGGAEVQGSYRQGSADLQLVKREDSD
jgi:hypothetical protein